MAEIAPPKSRLPPVRQVQRSSTKPGFSSAGQKSVGETSRKCSEAAEKKNLENKSRESGRPTANRENVSNHTRTVVARNDEDAPAPQTNFNRPTTSTKNLKKEAITTQNKQKKRPLSTRLHESGTVASLARAKAAAKIRSGSSEETSENGVKEAVNFDDLFSGAASAVFLSTHKNVLSPDGKLSTQILENARKSGQLNLSNQQLKSLPEEVFNVNLAYNSGEQGTVIGETPDFDKSLDEKDTWWDQKLLTKLFASGNLISEISDNVAQLTMLTVLDLSHNKIGRIPDSIAQCSNLTRLFLSHNCLNCLPENIGKLNGLHLLKVDHNELTVLPNDIGNLYYLEEADFSHNKLTELPDCLSGWRVKRLGLGHNCLIDLPKEVGWFQSLESLDLSENQLEILPGEVGELRKLESLNLTGNRLRELPVLEECLVLKELYLGNNRISKFPEDFFDRIPAIKVLDFHGNILQSLPETIIKAVFLERLNIADNDMFSILPELALIASLKSLTVDGNPVRTIRKDILKRPTAELLAYLRTRITNIDNKIDTDNESGDGLFNSIGSPRPHDAIRTKSLDLSGRDLESVPESFLDPLTGKDIQIVDLSNNRLTTLPAKLRKIAETVSFLKLAKNKLKALDCSLLANFRYLSTLDVSANQLESLEPGLEACIELRELLIASNRFTFLPDCVYRLKKLEVLIANNNKIVSIDHEKLSNLKGLTVLDVSNNEIDHVPPELGRMSLRSLKLEGNLFKVPRAQLLAKGTQEIMKYLRGRLPDSLPE